MYHGSPRVLLSLCYRCREEALRSCVCIYVSSIRTRTLTRARFCSMHMGYRRHRHPCPWGTETDCRAAPCPWRLQERKEWHGSCMHVCVCVRVNVEAKKTNTTHTHTHTHTCCLYQCDTQAASFPSSAAASLLRFGLPRRTPSLRIGERPSIGAPVCVCVCVCVCG
jgi:hypothetical protein